MRILLIPVTFKYKTKLLGNTVANSAPNQSNGILKNATILVPLKYLSNFWRSLEMPLINCKIDLKLKWMKYCVLSANGNDNVNDNDNANKITFTIKDTKLYVPVVNLPARNNQKRIRKGSERSVDWNEYKTNSENKNTTNEHRYFLQLSFVGVNSIFVLVYSDQDNNYKRFKTRRYYLPKTLLIIVTSLSME